MIGLKVVSDLNTKRANHKSNPARAGFFILYIVAGASLCFVSCTCANRTQQVAYQNVLQVNDEKLTTQEFSQLLARQLKQFDALAARDPNNVARVKEEVVKTFIMKGLVTAWAKKNNVQVDDADVTKEIDKIRASYPDDMAFRRVLAQENLSYNEWESSLRYSMLERKIFRLVSEGVAAPTAEEIKTYYEGNRESFKRKERIYLRQIVLDQKANADHVKAAVNAHNFEDMARKFSIAPEARTGGLVGWVEKGTVEIFDKAFDLKDGAVSNVMESPYGFHIFRVEKKSPAGYLSIDEAKESITRTLTSHREQANFTKWLDSQVRAAKVLRNNEIINSINVETRSQ
jgi:peptidyl-prolyl cis-trans isomerase C